MPIRASPRLPSRLSYSLAKARHRRRRHAGAPVVVFSMAKTGSSAVAAGLRDAGFDVHHVHDLDPAFLREEEAEYRWSGRPWRIWDAQQLVDRTPTAAAPWRVVSIVRDPIAQTVSAFFQPGGRRGYVHRGATIESLLEGFGDRLDRLPFHWFESHVEPALGIDVYEYEFDPGQRYQIISTPTVQLLLLRCEDLSIAPTALAELLATDRPIEVPRVNVGAEKDYADLYDSFRRTLRPTPQQLDLAYGSRPVRHFYAWDEIDRFRAVWSHVGGPRAEPPGTTGEVAR